MMKSSLEKIDDLPINDQDILEEEELDIVIHNITSGFECGNEINFKKAPQKYVAISPTKHHIKLKIDDCTVIVQKSGKALCMGASSENQALIVANKSVKILELWGIDASVNDYKVINIFCTTLLPWKIRIEAMVNKYPNDFMYEPEIQNYCSLKIEKGKGFLGVYPSGSIRLIGLTTEMVLDILERTLPVFSEFRS